MQQPAEALLLLWLPSTTRIVKLPVRSRPPSGKHLAEKGVESWASSRFLLRDLGHMGLGNCLQGLANNFAAHQGTAVRYSQQTVPLQNLPETQLL